MTEKLKWAEIGACVDGEEQVEFIIAPESFDTKRLLIPPFPEEGFPEVVATVYTKEWAEKIVQALNR